MDDPTTRARKAAARDKLKSELGADMPVTARDAETVEPLPERDDDAAREIRAAIVETGEREYGDADVASYEQELRQRRERLTEGVPPMPPASLPGLKQDSGDAVPREPTKDELQRRAAESGESTVTRLGGGPGDDSDGVSVERGAARTGPERRSPWAKPREAGREPVETHVGRRA